MLTLKQEETKLSISQVPVLLYLIGVLLTFPLLWSAGVRLMEQTRDGGAEFFLVFVVVFWYVMLEYLGLREEIIIDRSTPSFYRRVKGIFRGKEQQIPLRDIKKIVLETKLDKYGTRYQYLYLQSDRESYQINNPYLVRNEHHKIGRLISDFLNIPFQEV
jgi:hypothetical protein